MKYSDVEEAYKINKEDYARLQELHKEMTGILNKYNYDTRKHDYLASVDMLKEKVDSVGYILETVSHEK